MYLLNLFKLTVVIFPFFFAIGLSGTTPPQWVQKPHMVFPRSDFEAPTVGTKIYCGGGCNANQTVSAGCTSVINYFTSYDFVSQQWTQLTAMPTPRYRYASAVVGNKIYMIAGLSQNDTSISTVDVYDTVSGSWTQLPQGNMTLISNPASFVLGTKIYLVGGYNPDYTARAQVLVLDTSSTNLVFQAGVVADRTYASGDLGAVALNGYGYAFAGFHDSDWCHPLNYLEMYDPKANSWTRKASFSGPRGDPAYAVTSSGYLFIMGGETKDSSCTQAAFWTLSIPVGTVEMYNPQKDTWITIAPIAITRFRFSGNAYQNFIYDLGGQGAPVSISNDTSQDYYPVLSDVYALDTTFYFSAASVLRAPIYLVFLLSVWLVVML